MLFLCDIGNSSIAFALYTFTPYPGEDGKKASILPFYADKETHQLKNARQLFSAKISAREEKSTDEYIVLFDRILRMRGASPDEVSGVIISSVVPSLTEKVQAALAFIFPERHTVIMGPGVKTGLVMHVDVQSQIGTDIVCTAVAAANLFDGASVIFDLGTATVVSAIGADGAFEGTLICPGFYSALGALKQDTAQLPNISIDAPKGIIGKNSPDSMRSGFFFGGAATLDGLCDTVSAALLPEGDVPNLIACGGLSQKIVPFCRHPITVRPELIFEGMLLIYMQNRYSAKQKT